MVANAVIFSRYVAVGYTKPWPTLSFLCLFSITSIFFTLVSKLAPPGPLQWFMLGASALTATVIVQIFHCVVPQARIPEFWGVPLMPWTPCVSIFLNIYLLGSLDAPSYIRFGFFSGLAVLVYVFYSVHASYDAEEDGSLDFKEDVVSLEKINIVLS